MGPVWRLVGASLVGAMAFSMLLPLGTATLAAGGVPPRLATLFGLTPFAVLLIGLPVRARLVARLGARACLLLAAGAGATFAGLLAATTGLAAWCAAAALGGVYLLLSWGAVDDLVTAHAPPEGAGRTTGLYQALVGAALLTGPALPYVLGLGVPGAAGLAMALFAASAAWVAASPSVSPPAPPEAEPGRPAHSGQSARMLPLLAMAFVGGAFETGLNAVAPLVALDGGAGVALATTTAAAIAVGSLAAQVPVGRLVDQVGPAAVAMASATALLVASLALLLVSAWPPLLWLLALVWGGVGGGFYTLALALVALAVRGGASPALSPVMAAYTLGGVSAPALGGVTVQAYGGASLALPLALLAALAFVAGLSLPSRRRS